ncbi:MAG: GNAT family N-acetyltransferase [Pseudomonadota bacterium]|nr:GNAT family N-acetyltransferase [Pseudomonadales bacterium]MDY6920170.1 GNAT family N-acetyltransferase [Pseudomonadota bacterium]
MAELAEQHIIAPYDSAWYRKGCDLRRQVFMQEQGVSLEDEFDGRDPNATHMVSVQDGNVVGVLRILWLPEHAKIGRFAVAQSRRNEGIGSRLLQTALGFIERQGQERIMLEAQIDRINFYEHFGFEAYGEEYLDAGILHRAMKNY